MVVHCCSLYPHLSSSSVWPAPPSHAREEPNRDATTCNPVWRREQAAPESAASSTDTYSPRYSSAGIYRTSAAAHLLLFSCAVGPTCADQLACSCTSWFYFDGNGLPRLCRLQTVYSLVLIMRPDPRPLFWVLRRHATTARRSSFVCSGSVNPRARARRPRHAICAIWRPAGLRFLCLRVGIMCPFV